MAILGHTYLAALQRYIHVVDQMRADAADKVNRVLSG